MPTNFPDADKIARALARPLLQSQDRIKKAEKELLLSLVRFALHQGMTSEEIISSLRPDNSIEDINAAIEQVRQEDILRNRKG